MLLFKENVDSKIDTSLHEEEEQQQQQQPD